MKGGGCKGFLCLPVISAIVSILVSVLRKLRMSLGHERRRNRSLVKQLSIDSLLCIVWLVMEIGGEDTDNIFRYNLTV